MQLTRFVPPVAMACILCLASAGCGKGKSNALVVSGGGYALAQPAGVEFQCQILRSALNCNNYGLPNRGGMDTKVCEGESASTLFAISIGKHADGKPVEQRDADYTDTAESWAICHGAHIDPRTLPSGSGQARDFALTSPLGEGAARVFTNQSYTVTAIALPKLAGVKQDEISGFVSGLTSAP